MRTVQRLCFALLAFLSIAPVQLGNGTFQFFHSNESRIWILLLIYASNLDSFVASTVCSAVAEHALRINPVVGPGFCMLGSRTIDIYGRVAFCGLRCSLSNAMFLWKHFCCTYKEALWFSVSLETRLLVLHRLSVFSCTSCTIPPMISANCYVQKGGLA